MVPAFDWDWLGQPLALDFANTVRRDGSRYRELLRTGTDVADWAERQHDRVPRVDARDAARRLDEIQTVRDDVFAVLAAAAAHRPFEPQAVDRLNRRARRSPVIGQLNDRPGAAQRSLTTPAPPLDELLARVVDAAIEIAGRAHPDLAFCDAPSCGQFFIRHRTNQQWCGPACGTRARVARHAGHDVVAYRPAQASRSSKP